MVSVCCGCDGMYPWAGFVSGAVGSAISLSVSALLLRMRVDDPIDAFAVHAGGGAWGLVAGPLLRDGGVLVIFFRKLFQ